MIGKTRNSIPAFVADLERYNWLLIPLLAIPALWPLRSLELPNTYDGFLHFLRLIALDAHIAQGDLFPRWMAELFGGYGNPVFNFYSPSTYYLAELFVLAGAGYGQALVIATALLLSLAGFGIYLLTLDFLASQPGLTNRWGALVSAGAYMFAPYLMTNVYVRGAIAELGAQALLPWIFWSFRRLFTADDPTPYLLLASLSLGGLAVTHNISLMLVPPVLIGYLIVLWRQFRADADFRPDRLVWIGAAGSLAIGISAFFWLPMIGERRYLADNVYALSAARIPAHVWTVANFLDLHWPFEYTRETPYQFGVVQLGIGIAGFVVLKARSMEVWFWAVVMLILSLLAGKTLLPFWQSSDILLIVQFPWRLLTVISLPLALFTGGIVQRVRPGVAAASISALLIAMIVAANSPKIDWLETLHVDHLDLGPASLAQVEADIGTLLQDSANDFMPRWVYGGGDATLEMATAAPTPTMRLLAAGPHVRELTLSAAQPATLQFSDLYFPGWEATVDNTQSLSLRPGAGGLLTVDVPAGVHTLRLIWAGTRLQVWGRIISLTSLLLLALYLLWQSRWRLLAAAPLALLLIGFTATLLPPPTVQAQSAMAWRETQHGIRLLGYTARQPDAMHLELSPFWYIEAMPPDLRFRWQLLDGSGALLSQIDTFPYFNATSTQDWSVGTIVDDKYLMALPPGLEAGNYDLRLQIAPTSEGEPDPEAVDVGVVKISQPTPGQADVEQSLGLRFGDEIVLDDYQLEVGESDQTAAGNPVFKPGDRLDLLLHWRALEPASENYHGFVHLVGADGNVLAQQDQLPGPRFAPPMGWNAFYPTADLYRLQIPEDARSGLYTPRIGLYRFETGDRLPIVYPNGTEIGDSFVLPAIKVLGGSDVQPEHEINTTFEDVGNLIGYALHPSDSILRPGMQLTLTLIYRADGASATNYTQFVHLYDPHLGMAAQVDTQPLRGGNPTSAWIDGEKIKEEVVLVVSPDARPGAYRLKMGLYDPLAGGRRVTATDQRDQPLSNNEVILAEIEIAP